MLGSPLRDRCVRGSAVKPHIENWRRYIWTHFLERSGPEGRGTYVLIVYVGSGAWGPRSTHRFESEGKDVTPTTTPLVHVGELRQHSSSLRCNITVRVLTIGKDSQSSSLFISMMIRCVEWSFRIYSGRRGLLLFLIALLTNECQLNLSTLAERIIIITATIDPSFPFNLHYYYGWL